MKTVAAKLESDDIWEGLTVLRRDHTDHTDHTEPLSECVRNALRYYLHHLGDYEVDDLHHLVIAEVERPMIETVLEHTGGNQTRTAAMLGVSRSTLRKKMARYGIRREA
jgi:Fis family transcriptional regulator